jgi:thiol-disulfide isomerase/thioredoxin
VSFSQRDFLIGFGAGTAVAVFLIAVLVVLNAIRQERALKNVVTSQEELPTIYIAPDSPLTNYGEPDWNWELHTLDDDIVRFSNFRGRAALVNFWAPWCEPCLRELPTLQKLRDRLRREPITFVLISADPPDPVREYVEQNHISLPIYFAQADRPRVFRDLGIPVTFILSAQGEVVYKHDGPAQWDDESTAKSLEKLLQGPLGQR